MQENALLAARCDSQLGGVTVVATYAIGDIQRDLDYAHELSIFATVKF
jgi:hypothetical protein